MDTYISFSFDNEFFNISDTLSCGQVFRYKSFGKGYLVFSLDKCAYCYQTENETIIECKAEDKDYFYSYFDLGRDYSLIYDFAKNSNYQIVQDASSLGKGIRILNQEKEETLFSFIISQNNNIPRIKGILEKLCASLGELKYFKDEPYYAFPTAYKMAESSLDFFYSIGLGYRAPYIKKLAEDLKKGLNLNNFNALTTPYLKKSLTTIYGVGPKVADCVAFFGYHRSDSFPVDTWIEKVYRENFDGKLNGTEKISKWFVDDFKEYAGYIQQYLFHYKRNLENDKNNK